MTSDSHRLSFGAVAEHYDRVRPSYPPAAITWALGGPPQRIVDLGAGTGLLTRVVLGLGFDCTPVEPDPAMRAQLARSTPGVEAVAGSAEQIPLGDGVADGVVTGQAYHWFNLELAHPEIARVLRPGGVFAALWNDADLTVDWTVQYHELLDPERGTLHGGEDSEIDFGPLFTEVTAQLFRHEFEQSPQGLIDLLTSRSHFLVASPQRRAELIEAVRELCATHPELKGRATFPMPHVTNVVKAVKR